MGCKEYTLHPDLITVLHTPIGRSHECLATDGMVLSLQPEAIESYFETRTVSTPSRSTDYGAVHAHPSSRESHQRWRRGSTHIIDEDSCQDDAGDEESVAHWSDFQREYKNGRQNGEGEVVRDFEPVAYQDAGQQQDRDP